MEVNQMQLIEIGLNALGFLAGGGILMVLAAIFRRKESRLASGETMAVQATTGTSAQPESDKSGRGFEFIDLSGSTSDSTHSSGPSTEPTRSRRNRAEVYDLARRMLRASKPVREISDELSMSQAEVSLLKARSVQDKGVQHV